jgi:hypothetical protein
MHFVYFILVILSFDITVARVKYRGGDWYNDPGIIPNLAEKVNERTKIRMNPEQAVISLGDPNLSNFPFIFLTGHGDIKLSSYEVECLQKWLINGGFLYADDDYGMNKYFRREIKRVFPGLQLEEIPFDHPIYHCFYNFKRGLPKIHKHNGKPPKGYGIFYKGRMVVFYTYETNISDGWADPWVHRDPEQKREEAFRMGINIIIYAMTH